MFATTWGVLTAVWLGMLLGTGLVLVAAAAGWALGRYRDLRGVRLISWWLARVIVPMLGSRSWWRRSATIFTNNICVLSLLLAAGMVYVLALLAVTVLGVSLGVALRRLSEDAAELTLPLLEPHAWGLWRLKLGMALNLLEPPAIVVTLGLCLGWQTIPLSPIAAWETFAVWVVPAMFAAACGEALWLGAARPPSDRPGGRADKGVPPPTMEP